MKVGSAKVGSGKEAWKSKEREDGKLVEWEGTF